MDRGAHEAEVVERGHVFGVERQRLVEHLNRPCLPPQRLNLTLSLDGRVRLELEFRWTIDFDFRWTIDSMFRWTVD